MTNLIDHHESALCRCPQASIRPARILTPTSIGSYPKLRNFSECSNRMARSFSISRERCVNGQRHPYVVRLVLALMDQGWRWNEEFIWAKTTSMPGYWLPGCAMDGSTFTISRKEKELLCSSMPFVFRSPAATAERYAASQ